MYASCNTAVGRPRRSGSCASLRGSQRSVVSRRAQAEGVTIWRAASRAMHRPTAARASCAQSASSGTSSSESGTHNTQYLSKSPGSTPVRRPALASRRPARRSRDPHARTAWRRRWPPASAAASGTARSRRARPGSRVGEQGADGRRPAGQEMRRASSDSPAGSAHGARPGGAGPAATTVRRPRADDDAPATRTGSGRTRAGRADRRAWHPSALSRQLP